MHRFLSFAGLVLLSALTACGGGSKGARPLVIAVDVPVTGSPYIAQAVKQGVELGAQSFGRSMRLKFYDNRLSAGRAVENMRRAIAAGATAVITDGTGVDATWELARKKGVAIGIVQDGGSGLVDAETRPNVFRIAPTNYGLALRLAEYLVPKGLKVALLADDSAYGQEGAAELKRAFAQNRDSVALTETLPAGDTDLSAQMLRARRSGATALLVWAQPPTIAAVLTAARSLGWSVPVFTPPTGSDPFVRQQLARHPNWVDGLTFASGRMTAEVGAAPFLNFQGRYEALYGVDRVGVRTSAGRPVVQPPEFAMYAYDFVNVLQAAAMQARSSDPEKVLGELEEVTVEGANGDERGFNRHSHEGVVDDDVYFARFRDMTFSPVKDDPLSSTLPKIPQTSVPG